MASSFLTRKANERAEEIEKEYGSVAYEGSNKITDNLLQPVSEGINMPPTKASSFLAKKAKERANFIDMEANSLLKPPTPGSSTSSFSTIEQPKPTYKYSIPLDVPNYAPTSQDYDDKYRSAVQQMKQLRDENEAIDSKLRGGLQFFDTPQIQEYKKKYAENAEKLKTLQEEAKQARSYADRIKKKDEEHQASTKKLSDIRQVPQINAPGYQKYDALIQELYNKEGNISEEDRAKVEKAIAELNLFKPGNPDEKSIATQYAKALSEIPLPGLGNRVGSALKNFAFNVAGSGEQIVRMAGAFADKAHENWANPNALKDVWDINLKAISGGLTTEDRAKAEQYMPEPVTENENLRQAQVYGENVSYGLDNPVAKFGVNSALSLANYGGNLLLAGGNPAVALALMGTQSGTQTAYQIGQEGGSYTQQLIGGIVAGGLEVLTEKLPLDEIMKAWKTGGSNGLTRFLKAFVKGAIPEGGEEFVNTIANNAAQSVIMNDGQIGAKDFWVNTFGEALYSAAAGAVTGGFIAGTPAIFYSPEISSGITSNPTAMDTSMLMEDGGSSVAENTDIPEPVQKAVEMLLNGEAISGNQAAKIAANEGAVALLSQATGVDINTDAPISQVKKDIQALISQTGGIPENQSVVSTNSEQTAQTVKKTVPRTAVEQAHDFNAVKNAAEKTMGLQGAKTAIQFYDSNTKAADYYGGFSAYYQAGVTGMDMGKVKPVYAHILNEAQKQAAYLAGQVDASASLAAETKAAQYATVYGNEAGFVPNEHSASMPKKTVQYYNSLAKALGIKIQMTAATGESGANGWYKDGAIYIAVDAADPVDVIARHEITHRLQEVSPEAYRAFRDYAVSARKGVSTDPVGTKMEQYARAGQNLTTEQAMDEIAADFAGNMLKDSQLFEKLARENRSIAQKVLDAVKDFIAKVKNLFKGDEAKQNQESVDAYGIDLPTLEKAAQLWEAALKQSTEKVERMQKNTAQTDGASKLSIKYDQNNNPYVVIENDILAGVPRSEWVKTVKDNLRKKFPDGVTVGRSIIEINKQSRREMTFSNYMQRLMRTDRQLFADKLRATDSADEILRVARNWVNEALLHPRRDNIQEFARGEVFMQIGGNNYSAQVVVGNRGESGLLLYDIINLSPASIQERVKKADTPYTANAQNEPRDRQDISTNTSVSKSGENVNGKKSKPKYSLKMADGQEVEVESADYAGAYTATERAEAKKLWREMGTDSPYFKKFYEGNTPELYNEDGTPKVVYHGTANEILVFDKSRRGKFTKAEDAKLGFFFTDSSKVASGYAEYTFPTEILELRDQFDKAEQMLGVMPEADALFKKIREKYEKAVKNYRASGVYGTVMKLFLSMKNPVIDDLHGRTYQGNSERYSNLIRQALENGHDGVIIKNVYDTFGGERFNDISDVYIVFEPEQIKSAVYNQGTFDIGDPNARHSLKGSDKILRDSAALAKENDLLRKRVEYWKRQTKRTKQPSTDQKAVERAARELIRSYDADIKVSDISPALQSLWDYIGGNGDSKNDLTFDEAYRRAIDVARQLVGEAVSVEEADYSDLQSYLRDTKLTLSKEDQSSIADYADFRKRNFGRLNLSSAGTGIDQVYQELSERWPEFFDGERETHPADQLERIGEVLDQINGITGMTPISGYISQAVEGAANEILEMFFDIPQAKPTAADRLAEGIETKSREKLEKTKLSDDMYYGRKMAELREQNRERVQRVIQREREYRATQIEELKERYTAKDAAGRERQNARELRAKITRHTKELSKKLLRPNDKQHIPEELRGTVAAMLEAINQESQYTVDPETGRRTKGGDGLPTKRTEAFRALKGQYAKIIADQGTDMTIDPNLLGNESEGIQGNFDAVIAMKDTQLAEMSTAQLETIWQVVKAVEHSVSTAGKNLSNIKYRRTQDWANTLMQDTATRRSKRSITKGHALIDMETPYTFFSHYGEAGKAVYRMLRDAQDQQQLMVNHVAEEVGKIVDPKTVKAMEQTTQTFTTDLGEKLTLSTAQIMELYELMKRKQAHDHLLKGGIVQPEVKSAKIRRGTDSILLTERDLARITGTLTEKQIQIADGLQKLTMGLLADYGNKASMAAYGYKKFTGTDYWPIKSAKEGIHSSVEKGGIQTRSIKNIGMAKTTTPHASNPLDISGVFSTFSSHAADMTDYAAWLCTMEDANRLFNFRFRDGEGNLTGKTVKGILDRVGGANSQKYWYNLMEDIQSGINAPGDSPTWDMVGKGIGSFKGAAVGGNIRVVIQQPTAFMRALAVLSPEDLSLGLVKGVTKGSGWKKALQYSPIAMRKDLSSFDISSPLQMKEILFDGRSRVRKFNDVLSAPAGAADAVTWGRIWNACEWATVRKHKELAKGSAAFYAAVNQLFTEVIDQTQVVDGVLQRSNIMRSSNAVVKQATSFMGEPIMSLNLLLRAYDQVRYEQDSQKRGKAIKSLGRAATALIATNVVNALAQSIIDAMRDDDEDKKYWERFRSAFTGLEGDEESAWDKAVAAVFNGNVGSNMNLLGQIPFVKDALSLLQGYDVTRTEMEIISDLIEAGQTAAQSADGGGKKTRVFAVKELLAAGAKVFGIPVGNLTRDIWSLVRSIAVESDNIPLQYEMEKAIFNITNVSNQGRYCDILFRALAQGDLDNYQHIRSELMDGMGVDGADLDKAMRSRYKKALETNPEFKLSQRARDLIGSRDQYATAEKETSFTANDLSSTAYQSYAAQRASDYREMEDGLKNHPIFKGMTDEEKDKVLNAAYAVADKRALEDASNGRYQVESKWMTMEDDEGRASAENLEQALEEYGIEDWEYVLFHAAYEMTEGTRDEDNKVVKGETKKDKVRDWLEDFDGLTDDQKEFLWESAGYKDKR